MADVTRVALDAMGGDNAPAQIVKGAVNAVNENKKIKVFLLGRREEIQRELDQCRFQEDQIEIRDASEVIETAEPPVRAIRTKKNSSIVVGLNMVKQKEADAFVSAGSSGAILVGGTLLVGRIRGLERAPLAPLIPTRKGVALLVDCGANVDARPDHLLQFAIMGSLYMQHVMGIDRPRVALVNIGAEEDKGNALTKETYPLLRDCDQINFIGNIEARDITEGQADVIVCEAFVGNVILKFYEGTAKTLLGLVKEGLTSSLLAKIGAALALPSLKKTMKTYDASQYGGAPLLGVRGLVVKVHGSATAKEIKNALNQCSLFSEQDVNGYIEDYAKSHREVKGEEDGI